MFKLYCRDKHDVVSGLTRHDDLEGSLDLMGWALRLRDLRYH